VKEISEIQKDIHAQYKPIDTLLFGHTHQPVVETDKAFFEHEGKKIRLWNTGGWLRVSGSDADRYGGEIFLYETGKGFSSKKISVTHS
jgi:predicted phosphodiesterase